MSYDYITANNLENRQKYQYAKYQGKELIESYLEVRREALQIWETQSMDLKKAVETLYMQIPDTDAAETQFQLKEKFYDVLWKRNDREFTDKILQSFEVRKRLFHTYYNHYKPVDLDDYNDIGLYLFFSYFMAEKYQEQKNLKYLNALLKVNDTILSLKDRIGEPYQKVIGNYVLKMEVEAIEKLYSAACNCDDLR